MNFYPDENHKCVDGWPSGQLVSPGQKIVSDDALISSTWSFIASFSFVFLLLNDYYYIFSKLFLPNEI